MTSTLPFHRLEARLERIEEKLDELLTLINEGAGSGGTIVARRRPRRGPAWDKNYYYRMYAVAERRMKSPLTLVGMAAHMGVTEQTLRHYYYDDPVNGRYKQPGLGWGAPPLSRGIGE